MLLAEGVAVIPGRRLGKGGQGTVFQAVSHPGQVYKEFNPATLAGDLALERRLSAMVATRPPERYERVTGHRVLAWPEAVVTDGGRLTGYLMPEVDHAGTVELHRVTNPSDRRHATGANGWVKAFSWRYLVQASGNLAHATHVLHHAGVVIGDFNLKNVLVSQNALVTLIDCDSTQITDRLSGERFFCPVVMPEFQPPELAGATLHSTVRHASGDLYALAVHLFQLLLEGEHPFRGVWKGTGDKPSAIELARQGMWSLRDSGLLTPRPSAVDREILPKPILELFRRAFEDGATDPSLRPSAVEWRDALVDLGSRLRQCRTDEQHWYAGTLSSCPWCGRAASRTQVPLPPLQPSSQSQPQRVPPPPPPTYPLPNRHPGPAARSSGYGKTFLAISAVIAALICGGTAVSGIVSGNDDHATNSTATDTGTGTGIETGGGSDVSPDESSQASALHELLTSSGAARHSIQPAIANVKKCADLDGSARVFAAAAGNRSSHRSQADTLDYSALDNGERLHTVLVDALEASYRADIAFRDWANDLSGGCTRNAASSSSLLADAMDASAEAQSHKKTFVALWNPICDRYGWSAIKETDV
ncbi:hypothetical protein COUCH_27130 [Couchioplanes caeruleus]|uniref:hypothetical protein n=1 Tax=Couchioplanes caeruleus TaxID=56438 RepID=UPI0020BFB231|nr:hypothetical protein [Couchioplanes caeruleus]UQU62690.1 hypothetical protein COUCH_27130 [Couchioplanes caeruleus]